jgi:hypothetical protein
VRGLEKLWGIAIKEVDAIDDSILTALAGTEDGNESALNVWNDESKHGPVHQPNVRLEQGHSITIRAR